MAFFCNLTFFPSEMPVNRGVFRLQMVCNRIVTYTDNQYISGYNFFFNFVTLYIGNLYNMKKLQI
jgi:hypothetical protein